MNSLDLHFSDAYLSHQVNLLRFTAGEQKKVTALLVQLQEDLRVKLTTDLTSFSQARVNKLLKEATGVIDAAYAKINPQGKEIAKALNEIKGTGWFLTDDQRRRIVDGRLTFKTIKLSSLPKIQYEYQGTLTAENTIVKKMLAAMKSGDRLPIPEVMDLKGQGMIILDGQHRILTAKEMGLKEVPVLYQNVGGKAAAPTDLLALARHEAEFTAQTFVEIGLEASLPTEAALKALVNGSLIEGAPTSAWWAKQSQDLQFKFASQVRQGIAQNETLQQIIRRVAGSKKLGIPGIMDVSRRNASALVHSSIMQVANDARMATFKANDDIVKGVRFLATLDSHTSLQCIANSGAEWTLDGEPMSGTTQPFNPPPLHFNCRSMLVPVTLSYRELGIDVDEPKGTRASDLGQIPADTSFDDFLKRHDAAYVDDLLGPGRADLWRKGTITLSDLLGQTGRPLTLAQLKGK